MIENVRNRLYKFFIQSATHHCYGNCLDYFKPGSTILDVGIGNGLMIRNYHMIIKEKDLKITGIDINRHYLNHCSNLIQSYQLQDNIRIYREAVEGFRPPSPAFYDYILFSMSFMLFRDQQAVLDRALEWLKPGGHIVFFQTMFDNRCKLMDFIKPKLKYLTTVDFGTVVYKQEFYHFLEDNRLSVVRDSLLKREWFRGEYRLISAAPQLSAAFGADVDRTLDVSVAQQGAERPSA